MTSSGTASASTISGATRARMPEAPTLSSQARAPAPSDQLSSQARTAAIEPSQKNQPNRPASTAVRASGARAHSTIRGCRQ